MEDENKYWKWTLKIRKPPALAKLKAWINCNQRFLVPIFWFLLWSIMFLDKIHIYLIGGLMTLSSISWYYAFKDQENKR